MIPALGVLVSGRGTNLQSLIDANLPIAVVVSNVPGVPALERASKAGIAIATIDHKAAGSRAAFEDAVQDVLARHNVTHVVLAGFMRVLTDRFLSRYPDRVVNIHPSLLPAFPGVDAQKQAHDYGVKVTGATVHFVDAGTDTGPIILQEALAVREGESCESLRARLLDVEHRLLPAAMRLLIDGRLQRDGRRVRIG